MEGETEIKRAISAGAPLQFRSYMLTPRGERLLKTMVELSLERYDREDLSSLLLSTFHELIQNAFKAGLKRLLLKERRLNPLDPVEYQIGLQELQSSLPARKVRRRAGALVAEGIYFTVTLRCHPGRLEAWVGNLFPLLPEEERRIRQKFNLARESDSLYDFFLRHGDSTEGSGMGIAMVEILLMESGFQRRNLTVYTAPSGKTTVAHLVLPFDRTYISPRSVFDRELQKCGCSPEELRRLVRSGRVILCPD